MPGRRLDEVGNRVGRFRRHQQVEVVRHQHIGMDLHGSKPRRLAKAMEEEEMIALTMEYRLAIVAPVHDVRGNAGEQEPG
jgi:hypothetical protein